MAVTRFIDHLLKGTHAARPAATAVPKGTLYSCTSDNLVYQSDGATWSTWATLGTGGGGGGTVKDRRWNVGSGETSIDEFNNDTLDGAWVRVDAAGGSGRMTVTEGGDVLSLYNDGGDAAAENHAVMRPLSSIGGSLAVGDGFVTCVSLMNPLADYVISGLVLSDGVTHGSGNQIQAVVLLGSTYSPARFVLSDLRPNTNWTSSGSIIGQIALPGNTLYLRLARITTDTWRRDVSVDGISWIKGSATLTSSTVWTHVGFACSSWGTSTKSISSFEFLRRVSGVT